MRLLTILLGAAFLVACGGELPESSPVALSPTRIVSLDHCADQYVLKFAPRDHILAVSPGADENYSFMREEAAGVSTVRSTAEDVLALRPDLVVRSYGGGPDAATFFERAGVPVLEVGWAADIPSVLTTVERMAAALGSPDAGRAVVEDVRKRLAALPKTEEALLYLTPSGVTTGPGSLVHEIIRAAGYTNFEAVPGWKPIPLERLAYERPNRIAAAFFDTMPDYPDTWSPVKHPIAKARLHQTPVAALDGAWTGCAGWYLIEAVEAMARGGA